MTIKEAIEKAGPGGKIRRETWHQGMEWTIPDEDYARITIPYNKVPCPLNLTATDWEVVEPERKKIIDREITDIHILNGTHEDGRIGCFSFLDPNKTYRMTLEELED